MILSFKSISLKRAGMTNGIFLARQSEVVAVVEWTIHGESAMNTPSGGTLSPISSPNGGYPSLPPRVLGSPVLLAGIHTRPTPLNTMLRRADEKVARLTEKIESYNRALAAKKKDCEKVGSGK